MVLPPFIANWLGCHWSAMVPVGLAAADLVSEILYIAVTPFRKSAVLYASLSMIIIANVLGHIVNAIIGASRRRRRP